MNIRKPKYKSCKACGEQFIPYSSTQVVCNLKCAIAWTEIKKEKEYDRITRELKKNRNPTRNELLELAQKACNEYIRLRDKGQPCISCQKPPKKKNAGHYRSRGAAPELRFHPFNINLQCEHCNSFKSGNAIEYRINLINKIGERNVLWLEGKHEPQKWSIDEIKEIREYYKELIKEIKNDAV